MRCKIKKKICFVILIKLNNNGNTYSGGRTAIKGLLVDDISSQAIWSALRSRRCNFDFHTIIRSQSYLTTVTHDAVLTK